MGNWEQGRRQTSETDTQSRVGWMRGFASCIAVAGVLCGSIAHAQGFARAGLPWLPWAGLGLVMGSGLILAARKWLHARNPHTVSGADMTIMVCPPTRFKRKPARVPAPARHASQSCVETAPKPHPEPAWSIETLQLLVQEDFEALCLAVCREKGMRPRGGHVAAGSTIPLFAESGASPVAVIRCRTLVAGQADLAAMEAMKDIMAAQELAAGFFVAQGGFSEAARAYAQANRITPIDARLLLVMIQRLAPAVQNRLWIQTHSALAAAPRFCRGPSTEML